MKFIKQNTFFYLIIFFNVLSSSNNYHHNLWGLYNDLQGNSTAALQSYKKILSHNPPTSCYYGYINHLFKDKQYQTIVSLLPKVEAIFDQRDMQLIFAHALEQTGNKKKAEQRFIDIGKKHKHHPESVYFACASLIRQRELETALSMIDEYLNSTIEQPSSSIFYLLKAQIYLIKKDQPKAMENIKKGVELNPRLKKDQLFWRKIQRQLKQQHALHTILQDYIWSKLQDIAQHNTIIKQCNQIYF